MSVRKVMCGVAVAAALTIVTAMQIQPNHQTMLAQVNSQKWPFTLPRLPYSYNALEPAIDAKTVDIHYSRHHKTYLDNLNKALTATQWQNMRLEELFSQASQLPPQIRNNAGGHWNHTFYWNGLRSPVSNPGPSKKILELLEKNFGSFDAFKVKFKESALAEFGSGWAWLVQLPDGTLSICSSDDQDNPLMDTAKVQGRPLLVCDVWEHAYYLKYLNRRDEYMDAYWEIVNWQRLEQLLDAYAS